MLSHVSYISIYSDPELLYSVVQSSTCIDQIGVFNEYDLGRGLTKPFVFPIDRNWILVPVPNQ